MRRLEISKRLTQKPDWSVSALFENIIKFRNNPDGHFSLGHSVYIRTHICLVYSYKVWWNAVCKHTTLYVRYSRTGSCSNQIYILAIVSSCILNVPRKKKHLSRPSLGTNILSFFFFILLSWFLAIDLIDVRKIHLRIFRIIEKVLLEILT